MRELLHMGQTKRTSMMFEEGGHCCVYLIYGLYHCLNIVTEVRGFPAAVLIRDIKLISPTDITIRGPGRLCKYLGMDMKQNGVNVLDSQNLFLTNNNYKPEFITTTRIAIKVGIDKLYRFLHESS